jgi:hypothetical protein
LDFGVVPEECAKEISLKICNSGSANIPLELAIDHQVIGNVVFFPFLKYWKYFSVKTWLFQFFSLSMQYW